MLSLRHAWDRWQIINKVNGDFIAKVAIAVFYYTVCAAFALGALLISKMRPAVDPLNRKHRAIWAERRMVNTQLDRARKQF
jgi:hypothetical protein